MTQGFRLCLLYFRLGKERHDEIRMEKTREGVVWGEENPDVDDCSRAELYDDKRERGRLRRFHNA